MNFIELVQYLFDDKANPGQTLWASLAAFMPEIILCVTIVAILLMRIIFPSWKTLSYYLMLFGTATALYLAVPKDWFPTAVLPAKPIFSGLLVYDSFSIFMRSLLLVFVLLFTTFTQISRMPDQEDSAEFYVLILGAVVGMSLMVSANHLITVLIGVEMASVPSYVLAGFLRNRRKSSEAALKYAVYGAGAAGIMLFGMSLLAGVLGSAHLPTMARRLAELLESGAGADRSLVLFLGGLMVMIGVAFKLAAVPFHFWAPDVFEGASAEVAAFLSVASKAAALALLVRLATAFSFIADPVLLQNLAPARQYIGLMIAVMAAVTCTFGNLAAYGQTNMKRLLAYSTIAHAGYMMMPVAAAVMMIGNNIEGARDAVSAMAVYISIYLFMNLAAFAGVAFLRNTIGSEDLRDYSGLVRSSPGFTVCMAIVMFSLLGLPPLSGFAAKVTIFISLIQGKMLALLMIGVLNTVLSLFYYLRVVKVMTLGTEHPDRPLPAISLCSMAGFYFATLTVPVVALFFLWGGLWNWAHAAAAALLY
ncbi:MAG: NADH-quinone oxidoreductase subunit N [Thermoguttaceae bacterium]|jgi:NADH-quinone oxidoreductase subunit N